jgi:hypothetical protein
VKVYPGDTTDMTADVAGFSIDVQAISGKLEVNKVCR